MQPERDPLQDSEALLRAMIENLPGGAAFVVDPDLRYRLAEGEALSAAGFKPEDFVGRTIFEVLPPDLAASYEVLYRKALAGEPFEHEHNAHVRVRVACPKDSASPQENRFYLSRGTPLRSANGEVYGVLAVSYDITDRKQAEADAAADIEDTQRLCELSARLVAEDDIQTLYQEIVAMAIALTRADAGSIQILDEATQELVMLANQGAGQKLTEHFYRVNAGSNTPCGIALVTGKRTFVDFDVPESEDPHGSMRLHREEGYFSAQSTPLITRSGKAIGMFSTHWCKHHRPSDRELRFLDLLARQAADLIEQRQAQVAIAADLRDTQRLHELSTYLASEDNIQVLYDEIVAAAVDLMQADAGTIQILEEETQFILLLASQGLEQKTVEYFYRLDASSNTACGIALATRKRAMINYDVPASEDPSGSLQKLVEAGFLCGQSTPLISRSGKAIGMVSTHWGKHHRPSDRELRFLDLLARQAADLIEQRQAQVALRESEAKYRSLFQSIDEGYAVVEVLADDNGEWSDFLFLEVNPAFERQTGMVNAVGRKATEILGTPNPSWAKIYGRVAQTGDSMRFEQKEETLDRTFDLYAFRLGEAGSRLVAVLFTDITDRKRSEAQLRRAAEADAFRVKLSDALRSLTDSVEIQAQASRLLGEHLGVDRAYYVEYDEAEGYTRVNQNYLRGDSPSLVGVYRLVDYGWTLPFLQRGEAIIVADAQTSDIIPNADRELMAAIRITAHITVPLIKAGKLVGSLCVTESAPREWLAAEVELVRETAERIWATIIRARAETELRESEIQRVREQAAREEERQRAVREAARSAELAELDRAKTLFFSNVSHEFRTPLTLLLAPLQDALSDISHPLAPPQRERLELAHRNATRLLKLVNTLLDFSRIEAGRMEAVYEPTDLAMFTTELASVFRSAIERAGLRLIVDCPPLPEAVYVDRQMWEKIVLNLLSNAFKFTLEGEIAVRLHLADGDARERNGRGDGRKAFALAKRDVVQHGRRAYRLRHRVMLQIQDTGTGIPPEELPHVFERFYQVRRTKARTHEGSGIGLALVHELIRLHGGTVDVSSTVGQGTCFTITIPLGKAHLSSDHLRRVVGDSPSETLRERITATRTQPSTAVGAAPYVEEAERWVPEEGNREQGTGNREELSIPPDSDPPHAPHPQRGPHAPPLKRGENLVKVPPELSTSPDSDLPHAPPLKREENLVKVPLLKGDLEGSSGLRREPTPSPARVLLVDDNADMREYLTRILSEHVQVEAVADGASALAAAQERVPDLVLTDMMMPGLDGFELLKALRANPHTREVPIILLSARAGEESVVEGLEAGADDYLIKPFSAGQFVSRVKGHLQMAQLRLEALHQERTINRRKDELLSTVSHELNTPLVAILGWTRLLRANPSNQSMLMKSLETIERNATLQAKLIQDLLDITRITAGKLRLSLEPVELESVIENAIASIGHLAQAKQIDLVWWGVTGQQSNINPVLVQGDRDRLQQIVYNLLTNAIKFTPNEGSINVELSVIEGHNGSDASIAEISITDTGIGISAEFLPHIFDRFRQAEESSSSKGLGLGLAIARHLVELHGGTIHAESAGVGQGATFVVRLRLCGLALGTRT